MPSGNQIIFAQKDLTAETSEALEIALATEKKSLQDKVICYDIHTVQDVGCQPTARIQLFTHNKQIPQDLPDGYRVFQVASE